jgi:Ferritin-like domain
MAMSDHNPLTEIDVDGAIQETAEAAGVNRSDLLKRAAVGGGAVIGTSALLGMLPTVAFGASSGREARSGAAGDIAILNFALTLEYLEAAFYAESVSKGALKGETAKFAKVVASHEAQHVAFLKTALGAKAVKMPTFDFKGTTANQATFEKTAMALEDTGVSAYAGAAPLISNKKTLAAALSVHSVEARHAAWIRDIIGKGGAPVPAPQPFDPAKTKAQVLKIVAGTGFITG